VMGAHGLRHETGIGELIGTGLGESHGEGADGLAHHGRHESGQRARVNPTGQEQTEGHIAHEMAPHGRSEIRADLLSPLVESGSPAVRLEWKLPVAALLYSCLRRPGERPARLELSHASEECFWTRDEARG